MRFKTISLALGLLLSLRGSSSADGALPLFGESFDGLVLVTEFFVPDVHVEKSSAGYDTTLAFPIVVYTGQLGNNSFRAGFATFAEAQVQLGSNDLRAVLGERIYLGRGSRTAGRLTPLVEVGGVIGDDGRGGFVGTGVAFGSAGCACGLALATRVVMTDREVRGEMLLDFSYPWNAP